MFCIMICRESLRLFLRSCSQAFPQSVPADKNKKRTIPQCPDCFLLLTKSPSLGCPSLSLCTHIMCSCCVMFTCSFFHVCSQVMKAEPSIGTAFLCIAVSCPLLCHRASCNPMKANSIILWSVPSLANCGLVIYLSKEEEGDQSFPKAGRVKALNSNFKWRTLMQKCRSWCSIVHRLIL